MKNITLLLPTKDHEESILNNFAQLKKFCTENIKSFEILIISNGSSSHSLNLIEDIKHHSFVNHMILDKPGKGAAVKQGLINSEFKNITDPIDINCHCSTCKNYSLSYIHHLFKSEELLGLNLVTGHNIFFMNSLMEYIRNTINSDTFEESEKKWYLD